MTIYQPGQRIRLVHTNDPYTDLRPGDLGTVQRHDLTANQLYIAWDNGSRLCMLLDTGDRIAIADTSSTQPDTAASTTIGMPSHGPDRDAAVRAAAIAGGAAGGRAAADWWCEHTVGGRAGGDVGAAARRILAGIADGDPAVLDTLPVLERAAATLDLDDVLDTPLTAAEQAAAVEAYADAYDEAAEARVVELCHLAASPTGTDLTHLHPDRVDIGTVGVFSGDWHLTRGEDGEERFVVGFVGTLVDRWNGWAVFTCTRPVAEAIVADLDEQRGRLCDATLAQGIASSQVEQRVDADLARLSFDGDTLVADLRVLQDDPDAIERVRPDHGGRYIVMGCTWRWEDVDPYRCDRIVGDTPAPGGEREFVVLRHTPQLRLPHDRLRLTTVRYQPIPTGHSNTATLLLDGVWAATVIGDADGPRISEYSPYARFGRPGMHAFLAECRLGGAPVTERRLLDALADEYTLDAAITQATGEGGTQLRLVDDAGNTRALRPLMPAPRDYGELLLAARDIVADDWPAPAGTRWQGWTGTTWTTLSYPR